MPRMTMKQATLFDADANAPLREALRVTLDGQLVSQSSLLAGGY